MKRGKVIGIFVSVLVLGVMGLYLAKREREPEYNGKSLTEWLLLYERSTGAESDPRSYYDPAALQAAEHAVRQIGTNALPWLLKWIQCEPSSTGWRDKLAVVIDKLPGGLNDTSFVSSALRDRSDLREAVAFEAFRILGTNACSMAPELTRLMNESKSLRISERAMAGLRYLGRDGFMPLLAALENPKHPNRSGAGGLSVPCLTWEQTWCLPYRHLCDA